MMVSKRDCIDFMQNVLSPETVDLVICDPPYNNEAAYDVYQDTLSDEEYAVWTLDWIREAHRVLKPHGAIIVFIDCDGAYWVEAALRHVFLPHFFGEEGDSRDYRRGCHVWHFTFGQHQKKKLTRSHVHVFWWTKDKDHFTFNKDAVLVPSARQTQYGDRRANPKGRVPDDVYTFSRICGTFKERVGEVPSQLPLDMCHFLLKMTTNPGDIVYDPCCGSGSTLVAARAIGCRVIGTDISEQYVEITKRRLKGELGAR